MTYWWARRHIKLPPEHDRRRKLSPEQYEEIIDLWEGGVSQRKLARLFGVSRRCIGFIVNPASKEANLERRRETGGSKQYYDKHKHRKAMQRHRHHKQRVLKKPG